MQKDLYVIFGPTAIGKTEYSLKLAAELDAEIISADAFQVYRYMDIGTAKASVLDRQKIPHHLIDIKNPDEPYSVAEFLKLSKEIIQEIRSRNKKIIFCGGTAFYLNAFLYGYEFGISEPNQELRAELENRLQTQGNLALWQELIQLDPAIEKYIKPNDTKRIIRAFEIYHQTGNKPSEARTRSLEARNDLKQLIGLIAPREIIYNRINQRVDQMYKNGFVEEVAQLLNLGYNSDLESFKAIGYRETEKYIKGSISKEEMIELVRKQTRHFAKRQITWYRQFNHVYWLNVTE